MVIFHSYVKLPEGIQRVFKVTYCTITEPKEAGSCFQETTAPSSEGGPLAKRILGLA